MPTPTHHLTITPASLTELAIAADVLFDEVRPATDPYAVIGALCGSNPTIDTMVPTALAVCTRLVNKVASATPGQQVTTICDRLVELALGHGWQLDDESLARAKSVIRTVVHPNLGDIGLLGDPEQAADDFALVVQFIVALSAMVSRAAGRDSTAGQAILELA